MGIGEKKKRYVADIDGLLVHTGKNFLLSLSPFPYLLSLISVFALSVFNPPAARYIPYTGPPFISLHVTFKQMEQWDKT